jgi:hypothetical protein
MVTLGYNAPNGETWLVEVGGYDAENEGYWVIRLDEETREPMGGMFFAHIEELF